MGTDQESLVCMHTNRVRSWQASRPASRRQAPAVFDPHSTFTRATGQSQTSAACCTTVHLADISISMYTPAMAQL